MTDTVNGPRTDTGRYRYLFGPVPSRRLGISLGVDLVPKKVCSLDCVYCEVGKTTSLSCTRQEYIPADKIINELDDYFSSHPDPDYVTFSGSGEPTLNTKIGAILTHIRNIRASIPVAVLTNGTLFSNHELIRELDKADIILPSLDAASETAFQKINRPHRSLHASTHIQGLVELRKLFKGKILLEIFILPGYNDDEEELRLLKNAIERIMPDEIQLNTLDRPGTIEDLFPATRERLEAIRDKWALDNVRIISAASSRRELVSYRDDIESAIIETIARRPCTLADLEQILGIHANEINKYLSQLQNDKRITLTNVLSRGAFYRIAE